MRLQVCNFLNINQLFEVQKIHLKQKSSCPIFKVSFLHLKDSYPPLAQIGIGPQLQVL